MYKSSKRLIAMLICLAMVLSMLPMSVFAAGTTVYLNAGSTLWDQAGAWFSAWVWGSCADQWVTSSGTTEDGLYIFELPEGATSIIFCRNDPAKPNADWSSKWNQTTDLTIDTSKPVYVITGWGESDGQWIELGGEEPEVDENYYLRGTLYNWDDCDDTNRMTDNGDGTWSITLSLTAGTYEYKAAWANWTNGVPAEGNQTITMTNDADVTFTLDTNAGTLTHDYVASCDHTANVTILEAVEPTCTETGLSEGVYCNDCEMIVVEQLEQPALGHTVVDGSCSVCGAMAEYITVYFQNNWMWSDVKIHTFGSGFEADTEWPGVAMELYGNDGNYDIYSAVIPADAKIVITGIKNDGSDALDQTPDITDAVDGNCYYMIWDEANSKNGVGFANIEVILPSEPECEHEYTYECDVACNKCYEITREASHSVVYVEAVAGTDCQTWDGNVEYWYCSDCGACWLDEAQTQQTNRMSIVAAGEHAYDYDCSSTCNICGEETREAAHEYFYACDAYCMICGELTNEEAAHTVNHVDAVAATDCQTWDGNVEYWYCSDCGACWLDEAQTQVTNRMSVACAGEHSYENNTCTVCGELEYTVKFQAKNDGTAIRLLSYVGDLSEYASVTFNVTIGDNTTELTCTNAYKSLLAGGNQVAASSAFGEDAEYFVMYTLTNITEDYYDMDMTVSVTWTAVDGTETTSEARTVTIGDLVG